MSGSEDNAARAQRMIEGLSSEMCQCGSKKRRKQSFCSSCYYKLPKETRAALYRRIGSGYEEAYDHAVGLLREVPDG